MINYIQSIEFTTVKPLCPFLVFLGKIIFNTSVWFISVWLSKWVVTNGAGNNNY